ncbi:MAG: hypothetical protein ACI8PT_003376, partial [Gammaproteobacteria bacterium]
MARRRRSTLFVYLQSDQKGHSKRGVYAALQQTVYLLSILPQRLHSTHLQPMMGAFLGRNISRGYASFAGGFASIIGGRMKIKNTLTGSVLALALTGLAGLTAPIAVAKTLKSAVGMPTGSAQIFATKKFAEYVEANTDLKI